MFTPETLTDCSRDAARLSLEAHLRLHFVYVHIIYGSFKLPSEKRKESFPLICQHCHVFFFSVFLPKDAC